MEDTRTLQSDGFLLALTAQADLWALLTIALQFPSSDILRGLSSGAVGDDARAIAREIASVAEDERAQKAAGSLERAAELLRVYEDRDDEAIMTELRREHTRLFSHPDHAAVSPFEGVFLDRRRAAQGKEPTGARIFVNPAALDAEREYRQAALKAEGADYLPADSITTETLFVGTLISRAAQACADGRGEEFSAALAQLEEFETYHIAKWFDPFFSDCVTLSSAALYRFAGHAGKAATAILASLTASVEAESWR